MPDFVATAALRKLSTRPPSAEGWVHEIKFDGYRIQMRVEDGEVTLKTRKGLDWTDKFPAIAKAAAKLPDAIIDGEICRARTATASRISRRCRPRCRTARPMSWSSLRSTCCSPTARICARCRCSSARNGSQAARALANRPRADPLRRAFRRDGDAVLHSALPHGLEGIISKRPTRPIAAGRGESWIKTKCRAGHEVVIGGWTTTGGKFRSLLVGVYNGDHLVYTGRVGTGYGRDTVKRIMPALKARQREKSLHRQECAAPAAATSLG